MFKILGIFLILIGIALAVVPRFTDCQSQGEAIQLSDQGTTPMKCHWTGIAELGVAIPMYLVGAIMTTSQRRGTLTLLSLMGVVLGGLAIAFPAKLIGVCPGHTMICATLMRPALVCLGGMAIGLSGLGLSRSEPVRSLAKAALLFFHLQSLKRLAPGKEAR